MKRITFIYNVYNFRSSGRQINFDLWAGKATTTTTTTKSRKLCNEYFVWDRLFHLKRIFTNKLSRKEESYFSHLPLWKGLSSAFDSFFFHFIYLFCLLLFWIWCILKKQGKTREKRRKSIQYRRKFRMNADEPMDCYLEFIVIELGSNILTT